MKKAFLSILALAMLFTAACSVEAPPSETPAETQQATGAPTEEPSPLPTDAPAAESEAPVMESRLVISQETEYEEYAADDGKLLLTFSYALPVVEPDGNDAAAAKINARLAELRDYLINSEDEGSGSLKTSLASATELYADGQDFTNYALEHGFTVERGDGRALSFKNSDYTYWAGAHGFTGFTGLSFDAETGAELSLADLSDDADALIAFAQARVLELAEGHEYAAGFVENYRELIPNNIAGGFWYFSREGLTFIYNAYDIGPYAMGPVFFTVPYAELRGVIDDKWLPEESAGAGGQLLGGYARDMEPGGSAASFVLSDEGANLAFVAEGDLRSVTLKSVDTFDGVEFHDTGTLGYVSRLSDGESIVAKYLFIGAIPHLSVSYETADGAQVTRLVALSGEDGSVLLIDPEG